MPDNDRYLSGSRPNVHSSRPRTVSYEAWGSIPAAAAQPAQAFGDYGNHTAPQLGSFASAHQTGTRQDLPVAHEYYQRAGWEDLQDTSVTGLAAQHEMRHPQPQRLDANEYAGRASHIHRAISPFEDPDLGQPWEETEGQGLGDASRPSVLGGGIADDPFWEQAGAGKLQEPMVMPGCWPRPPSTNRTFCERQEVAPVSRNTQSLWQDHNDPAGRFPARQPGPSPRNLFATHFTAADAEGSYEPSMEGWLEGESGFGASLSQVLEEDCQHVPTALRSSVTPERQEVSEQTADGWDPANVLVSVASFFYFAVMSYCRLVIADRCPLRAIFSGSNVTFMHCVFAEPLAS